MSRGVRKLTARTVASATTPGRYGDGGGLWLQVSSSGTKSWLLRYMIAGRARHMGLGSVELVSLAEARDKAIAARRQILDGRDPIEAKAAERAQTAIATALQVTFRQCADRYIAAHSPSWRNEKHQAQWSSTLTTYCHPSIGHLPVAAIDVGLVLGILEPVWSTKPETASRLRGRLEAILDWAAARGYRSGDNPARWRGHLDKLLPARSRVRNVAHHAALPYADLPVFMAALRDQKGVAARALEFAILTAGRTGEVIAARWAEIDSASAMWTVPADRMKGGREHRVPLSGAVTALLSGLPREGEFVFPGARSARPLSNMSLLMTLRRMNREDLTAHGFRSTFRDWVAEQTTYPAEVAEMALAHVVANKVEAAYRRGDLFEKRRRMMDDWACHCVGRVQ